MEIHATTLVCIGYMCGRIWKYMDICLESIGKLWKHRKFRLVLLKHGIPLIKSREICTSDVPSSSVCNRGVRDLVTLCFEMVGRPVVWRGEGLQEEGALADLAVDGC